MVNNLCTGFGVLTLKLRGLQAERLANGHPCEWIDSLICDPYVKVFINGEPTKITQYREDTCCYDVGETYISKNISKSSVVKIEVWDSDTGEDDLVLTTNGTIDSFLQNGFRNLRFHFSENYIATAAFWEDDYKKSPNLGNALPIWQNLYEKIEEIKETTKKKNKKTKSKRNELINDLIVKLFECLYQRPQALPPPSNFEEIKKILKKKNTKSLKDQLIQFLKDNLTECQGQWNVTSILPPSFNLEDIKD